MGCCVSQEAKWTRLIETQLTSQKESDERNIKILILGPGGSGKSTVFKQMSLIHGSGFSEQQRKSYKNIIYLNILETIKELIVKGEILAESPEEYDTLIGEENEESRDYIYDLELDEPINDVVAQHIENLWKDVGVENTYKLRHLFQLNDSAQYYMDRITTIGQEDWVPDDQDVLRSRVRTTGIIEKTFMIDGKYPFQMYDMGGQRSERKKWIHCFDDVHAVIFVMGLSGYNQALMEDNSVNRTEEALNLFYNIVNAVWFSKSCIVLFLNKYDLFKQKIEENADFKEYFPDYEGKEGDVEAAQQYVLSLFEQQSEKEDDNDNIYPHVTQATDTNQMQKVFDSVKHNIMKGHIADFGFH